VARRIVVRVPASSANLGPGFDSFAAAIGMHMQLEVEETGSFAVETELTIARDRRDLVVRAFSELASPERFCFRIRSEIPLSGGLGSSAAAHVAGLVAAAELLGARDEDLLDHATRLEGHPDNAAAALLGGFVICADDGATRFTPPDGLEAVVVVPGKPVRTKAARAALPAEVPMADAVFNTAHGALLALGLAQGDLELVARGLDDRLHQPRREHLYPQSMELVRRAPALGALGATISGAGPTVLVWCRAADTEAVTAALETEAADWAQVLAAPFEAAGAQASVL
jgi:homoserine kinase